MKTENNVIYLLMLTTFTATFGATLRIAFQELQ